MTHQRAAALLALALLAWSAPAYAQRLTRESAEAVERWADAVNRHVPGAPDASVAEMTAVSYAARVQLSASYPFFIRALRGADDLAPRNDLERLVIDLALRVRKNPGAAAFLRRGAILHLDAVVFARRFPAAPDDTPWAPVPGESALLAVQRLTLTRDGQIVGSILGNWNLPFARSLLDEMTRLPPDAAGPADRAFISDWYHAAAAYLLAAGMNGDATSHLAAAARALPDDAQALFDRGTNAETLGLPIYQTLLGDTPARGSAPPSLPPEQKTNGDAEQLYRRALEVAPGYVEARVRLARLIARRGAYEDAAAEIAKALDQRPAAVTGYYAHLVAGRIDVALGRYEQALAQYQEAVILYPDAQAARLGASEAALLTGDLEQMHAALEHLGREELVDADPWWDYRLGAGRDAMALLTALWRRPS